MNLVAIQINQPTSGDKWDTYTTGFSRIIETNQPTTTKKLTVGSLDGLKAGYGYQINFVSHSNHEILAQSLPFLIINSDQSVSLNYQNNTGTALNKTSGITRGAQVSNIGLNKINGTITPIPASKNTGKNLGHGTNSTNLTASSGFSNHSSIPVSKPAKSGSCSSLRLPWLSSFIKLLFFAFLPN
ncbi:hypothetical protein BY996DRAFT_6409692 [Phakopsora pachyrhizi]|nr:hypothetical protein BY996DRAFT_6409692 [Phakopsora pachyrhizi]